MVRGTESPYPANAMFGVYKGFKTGVYTEYRDFMAQTADYPGGKEQWAVFTNAQHAREYVSTGRCPVRPLAQKPTIEAIPIPDSSAQSLPTPDPSPETDAQPAGLPTRQRPSGSAPLGASASQPPPAAPRKPPVTKPDGDSDTEPEEDYKPPRATLPAATSKPGLPRRPYKLGSITSLLRHASANGELLPRAKTPPLVESADAAPVVPAMENPPAAPPASAAGPSNRTRHAPPPTSSFGRKAASAAPISAPVPSSAPAAVPVSIPGPPLVPKFTLQPRPHGTYEQCHHCNGHGWIATPAQPAIAFSSSQPSAIDTPSRPRAIPTTNLRILSAASDSDHAAGVVANKIRTPSGSRLRVSSVGVGPERTPKRDPKRTVSDSIPARRARLISEGAKDKGKGKARAIEPMYVDTANSEAGPSTYNYIIYALIVAVLVQYDKLFQLCILVYQYA